MRKTQDSVRLGADLRELAASGSTVDCSVARIPEENTEVEICQVGGVHESTAFELRDGRTGYIMDLEITNQTSKTIYCSQTELRMQWEDALFDWLPDPKETGRTVSCFVRKNGRRERVDFASESYCFSGGTQLEYPRDLVLNHILLKGCALQPSCPLKGLLLAIGGPMPDDLRHGQWLEPTLALTASNHREYTAPIQLWTERLEVDRKRATRTPNPCRDPLGFVVGSPVVVGYQRGAAHTEKSGSLHTDGTVESSSEAP
jgi:hypothetical protein